MGIGGEDRRTENLDGVMGPHDTLVPTCPEAWGETQPVQDGVIDATEYFPKSIKTTLSGYQAFIHYEEVACERPTNVSKVSLLKSENAENAG